MALVVDEFSHYKDASLEVINPAADVEAARTILEDYEKAVVEEDLPQDE